MPRIDSLLEAIQTFGEAPSSGTDVEEVQAAEEQTKEKKTEQVEKEQEHLDQQESEASDDLGDDLGGDEEDTPESDAPASDEEALDAAMRMMSRYQLATIRFTPRYAMEYGSPSGSDSQTGIGEIGGCPGCGDAADAAIIDAEITPSDGSGDNDEAGGDMGDMGGDLGGGEDEGDLGLGEELRAYFQARQHFDKLTEYQVGNEGLWNGIKWVGKAVYYVFLKTVKFSRRVWKGLRNNYILTNKRCGVVAKFWNFKLNGNLDEVDMDRLQGYEVEAFPLQVWLDVCRLTLDANDLVTSAERLVFDAAEPDLPNSLRSFQERMKREGVIIDVARNKVNMDELLDKRRFESVTTLGYSKSQIPNVIRYVEEIGKRIPKNDRLPAAAIVDKVTKRIANEAARLSNDVEKGELTQRSDEYKKRMDRIVTYAVRLDFILSTQSFAGVMLAKLADDAQKVFSKYEDAMDWSRVVD